MSRELKLNYLVLKGKKSKFSEMRQMNQVHSFRNPFGRFRAINLLCSFFHFEVQGKFLKARVSKLTESREREIKKREFL